ncbi:DUF1800 domain-containing protein [Jeongeupia naejangsanensis]|uniref:DUF1800 domain-containing protein n=1 Tax=Jeongeupia naejangsanensis TaxID=613195 RepID=A0ABS2BN52_9NEIS|nr:DUF1800 domain-containing protein [Jeongeupia naejangsanensis]MBM3116998.1 DUF1800 domain-containing protein [Jeongeupia naejangsanensis]
MLKPVWVLALAGLISAQALQAADADFVWLRRLGFGVDAQALDALRAQGINRYLDAQLGPEQPLPVTVQAQIDAMQISSTGIPALFAQADALKAAIDAAQSDTDKQAAKKAHGAFEQNLLQQAMQRNLLRAIHSPDPLRQKLVWFWFNQFNVFSGKGNGRLLIPDYEENAIRPYALGRFRDLVMATLKHPAMLVYLDNAQNAVGKLNENYARELMELHTLGVDGGYTQADVQALARILTGVGVNLRGEVRPRAAMQTGYLHEGGFEFIPRRHDWGDKVLLGQTIKGTGFDEVEAAVTLLCRQPATARHISQQLATYLLGSPADPKLVARMAEAFLRSDGDIAATVRVLFLSPQARSAPPFYTDPYRYVVSALRQGYAGQTLGNVQPAINWLNQQGEPLYGRLTPDGYPIDGDAWASDGQMVKRFEVARSLAGGRAPLAASTAAAPSYQWRFAQSVGVQTRSVLDRATTPTEWNLLWLSAPEMNHD